jgi:cytochrome c biogenesis protein CcdA
MVVELPTAFPYFAAIAAIVGSGVGVFRQLVLLAVFNLVFALPLLAIAAALLIGGTRGRWPLTRDRELLERHWPKALATALGAIGGLVIVLGMTGPMGAGRGHVAYSDRHLHPLLRS